jgi:two-component system, sensor histidine kinase YesM
MVKEIFRKKRSARRVFALYFPVLFLITAILSFSLLYQSQRSLLSYALLNAQKSNEVLQAALCQAADQISIQFALLHYDTTFRSVMEADSYSQLSPDTLDAFRDTVGAKSNLPSGAAISFSSSYAHYSTIFLTSQLQALDAQMPQGRGIQALGLFSPQGTLTGKHYLIFGFGYFSRGAKVGNVYITLNPNELVSTLAVMNQQGLSFVLADGDGNMILLGDEPQESSLETLTEILFGDKSFRRYVTEETPIPKLNCTLYSIVDTAVSLAPVQTMYITTFAALLLLILVSLVGNLYLGRSLVQPLSQFSQYLSELRKEQTLRSKLAIPPTISGCMEIQEIEGRFSALLESIAALNAEVQQKSEDLHQAELLRKDMEIRSLRSQINPHFLYNTLELIRADATMGRIDQVSAITAAMGRFYRYSIKGSPIVTLKEEMEHVKAYMTIQQERWGGRISVLYNITPEAERVPIPKMILQPLVENAIVHGLEPAGGGGILFVGASVQDHVLTISVRDSGIGISPEKLQELEQQPESPDRGSIGLANVRKRLRLQYGSASTFRIESSPNDGTCIYLSLPAEPLS